MHTAKTRLFFYTVIAISLLLLTALGGCSPAATPVAATPTTEGKPTPLAQPGAYPAESTSAANTGQPAAAATAAPPAALPAATLPGYPVEQGQQPPAAAAPGLDNLSKVTARLIEQSADSKNPGFTRLRAEILDSTDEPGMPNRTKDLVNKEVDLLTETAALPALNPGDNFTAKVLYRGDESGGMYFASAVSAKP